MVPYYGYGDQTSYMLYLFFIFFVIVLSCHYYLHDQKTEVTLFDGFKIELRLNFGPPKLVCPKSVHWCRKQPVSNSGDYELLGLCTLENWPFH